MTWPRCRCRRRCWAASGWRRPVRCSVLGLTAYGPGLSTFVVLALPGRVGFDALNTARDQGALPVQLPGASAAYQTSTILINGLIVRNLGDRQNRRTYLLAGPVDPDVLRRAATELLGA